MEKVNKYNFKLMAERVSILLDEVDQLHREISVLYHEAENIDGIEAIEYLADIPRDLWEARELVSELSNRIIFTNNDIVRGMKQKI